MNFLNADTIIIHARLVIDSVLHIGAGDFLNYSKAQTAFRNGNGEPVIPGASIAGVLVEEIRSRLSQNSKLETIYPKISGKGLKTGDFEDSILSIPTLGLCHKENINFGDLWQERDLVKLIPETRTAEEKGKFAFEVLSPGLWFDFIIILDMEQLGDDDEKKVVVRLLIDILAEQWSHENSGQHIGANSARGMGWFHLEDLVFTAITEPGHLRVYLDDCKDELDWISYFRENLGNTEAFLEIGTVKKATADFATKSAVSLCWPLSLTPRKEEDSYGWWPVLIRSSRIWSLEQESDHVFMMVKFWDFKDDKWDCHEVPVIPGSSMRGAAKALLNRLAGSKNVSWTKQEVQALFGTEDNPSALKFRDAYFYEYYKQPEKYSMRVQRNSQDEFTRGIYNKFNDSPMFSGTFNGCIFLENPTDKQTKLIEMLFKWSGPDNAVGHGIGAHSSPMTWEKQ